MPQLTTFPPYTKKIQNSLSVCVSNAGWVSVK